MKYSDLFIFLVFPCIIQLCGCSEKTVSPIELGLNSSSSVKSLSSAESEFGVSAESTSENLTEAKILKGFAMTKVALDSASVVEVFELDSVTFETTGKVFRDTIKDDKGSFAVDITDLNSRYVLVSVREDSSAKKVDCASLYALVDISKNRTIHVNDMTHMEYRRCMYLLQKANLSFEDAKKKARMDVLKAFYIDEELEDFESLELNAIEPGNVVLCAVSMLVRAEYDSVSKILEKEGVWEEDSLKATLADLALGSIIHNPYTNVYASLNEFDMVVSGYEGNAFSVYSIYRNFWMEVYGMGECDSKNEGDVKQRAWNNLYYTCKTNDYYGLEMFWFVSTDMEKAAAGKHCDAGDHYLISDEEGRMYVCDSLKWRDALAIEKQNGVCASEYEGVVKEDSLGFEYVCGAEKWEYNFKYFTDERDGHEYRYLLVGSLYWMVEDVVYHDSVVSPNLKGNMNYGEGSDIEYASYTWTAAMDLDSSYGSKTVKDVVTEKHRGICPDGWRIPSSEDWNLLMDAIGDNYKIVMDFDFFHSSFPNSTLEYWSSTETNGTLVSVAMIELMTVNVPSVHMRLLIASSEKDEELIGGELRIKRNSLRCVKDAE